MWLKRPLVLSINSTARLNNHILKLKSIKRSEHFINRFYFNRVFHYWTANMIWSAGSLNKWQRNCKDDKHARGSTRVPIVTIILIVTSRGSGGTVSLNALQAVMVKTSQFHLWRHHFLWSLDWNCLTKLDTGRDAKYRNSTNQRAAYKRVRVSSMWGQIWPPITGVFDGLARTRALFWRSDQVEIITKHLIK